MHRRIVFASFLFLAVTCLLIVPPVDADVTGGILGVVTDSSGAVVPDATITLTDPHTGLRRTTRTDSTGAYQFLLVPVAEDYRLDVEARGFEKASQAGITLLVNQRYRADFTLTVGSTTQSVTVSAAPAQVETTSTQLGDVIEDKKMTTLPLNGRSYIDLLGLQAGVVPITSSVAQTDRPVSGNGNAGNVSVNGQREAANSFLVNGGDVEEGRNNGASVVPNLDSIQEFRLITNSFDAEYGRFSGAIVNVITKSGTNQFHGTAFEFLRNEKLNARNFFEVNQADPATGNELPGTARAVLKRNQFGGAGGGPILKDKLFFFSDYQGTREVGGVATNTAVPSVLERTGNFSDVGTTGFPALTGTVPMGDGSATDLAHVLSLRLGYPVTSGEPFWAPGCTSTAACVFPGQIIPQSAWSPVAAATLKYVPLPVGSSGGQPFFSSSAGKQVVNDDKFAQRIDLNTRVAGNWNFYYYIDNSKVLTPLAAVTAGAVAANVPGFPDQTPSRAQQFNLGNSYTFGPTAVNELRLNYTRSALIFDEPVGGLGKVQSFGFKTGGLGIIPVNPQLEGLGPIGLANTGPSFGLPDGTTGQYNNTYQILDNFSKIVGPHTIKFGGETRYLQINERNTYAQNGFFTFNGSETGNDFADYLIGAISSGNFIQSSRQFLDSRTKYFALYGQDTYKVKPNFTLNYGLRWEVSEPFYDTQGKIQTFVPGEQSRVYPDAPRGWVFPGDPGIPQTLAPTRKNNFAPRFGFAYSPGFSDGVLGKLFGGPGHTSIRGATGIYYTAVEDLTLFVEVGDAPFGLFYVSPAPVYLDAPYQSILGSSHDPGQRFPFSIPKPGATGIWPQFLPIASAPVYKPDNVLPYAEHFNFNIQRQIGKTMTLTVGYVGTRGHHLIAQEEFNPGNAALCLSLPGCGPFGEDTFYTNSAGKTVVGTRPYSVTSGILANGPNPLPDFQANAYETTIANSRYNALETTFERRVGAVRLLAAYTYSKSLDNSSGFNDYLNPFNPGISRSLSAFDLTHNFVVSYSYDLPFQKLTPAASGAVHKLLDGWTVTGITRFTTGLPINIRENDDRSLTGCSGSSCDQPNYSGQSIQFMNPRASANHQYFSTTPFSLEGLGTIGNASRRFFHGPGLNNWDFALHKDTHVTERTSIELRAEFFNVFNHAQFSNPSGTINSSRFGLVSSARPPRIGQVALKFIF